MVVYFFAPSCRCGVNRDFQWSCDRNVWPFELSGLSCIARQLIIIIDIIVIIIIIIILFASLIDPSNNFEWQRLLYVLELWRSESDRYGNCSLCSVHRTCPLIFYLCHCVAPAQVWWLCRDWFFTARRVCIARTMPSQDVYLPVCLSVKRRYCV